MACAGLFQAAGCGGLGKCDENAARSLVVNGEGQALYAGQAIINRSCAGGQCHASGAAGSVRQGVPKGLDFNLEPAPVLAAGAEGSVPSGGLSVDATALSTLRQNQRRVFDDREEIYAQIDAELMPPPGVGAAFRQAPPGAELEDSGTACSRGSDDVPPISAGATRRIVKNWLACGAPVVEVSNAAIPVTALKEMPAGRAGSVGQQMPLCSDPTAPVTFEGLFADVFQPSCVTGCHTEGGIWPQLDLSTVDKAFDSLTVPLDPANRSMGCPTPPFVVPGKPEESYLVAKMGGSEISSLAVCGYGGTMPLGQAVLQGGVLQVASWISAGAPRSGTADMSGGGADAGM